MVPADDGWSEALEQFGQGRYVSALEGFERLWRRAGGEDRDWFQGWLLLAAALFHRDRGNARGARACLDRAEGRWRRLSGDRNAWDPQGTLAAVREVLETEWARPRLSFASPDAEGEGGSWEEDWNEST